MRRPASRSSARSSGRLRTRWSGIGIAVLAGLGTVALPPAAEAAPAGGGPTGLHDEMLSAASPDAQGDVAAGTAAGTTAPAAGTLVGVDVSGHQHGGGATIDWAQVAAGGQSFAIVKATELYTDSSTGLPVLYTNPYLHTDLDGAHAAGLVVGSYTYAHPENDPDRQADAFASAIGTLPTGSLPPVLDLETTGGLGVSQLVAWTQAFLNRLEFDTGIIPMIYTGPNFWNTALGNSTAFTRYPLWEAHYTTNASPYQVGGWSTYDLWQFTSSATVPGISTPVDQSRFNGTDLTALVSYSGMPLVTARATDPTTAAVVGAATSGVFCNLPAGGCGQHFANAASIYWSPGTGAQVVAGGIRGLWAALGWERNLGYPVGDQTCGLRDGGCAQHFANASSIFWSPATGAHEIRGGIRDEWAAFGVENGGLAYPITGQACGLRGGGCGQHFQGGSIFWSPATGAHVLSGGIRGLWAALGGENNLGYPTTEQACGLRGGGCGQHFEGGSIFWSPASGAHEVRGGIRNTWVAYGGHEGGLGYPITGQACGLRGGGCGQHFQGGSIFWSPRSGAQVIGGSIRAVWTRAGAEHGRYGYPTSGAFLSGRYWVQHFQGGTIRLRA